MSVENGTVSRKNPLCQRSLFFLRMSSRFLKLRVSLWFVQSVHDKSKHASSLLKAQQKHATQHLQEELKLPTAGENTTSVSQFGSTT